MQINKGLFVTEHLDQAIDVANISTITNTSKNTSNKARLLTPQVD